MLVPHLWILYTLHQVVRPYLPAALPTSDYYETTKNSMTQTVRPNFGDRLFGILLPVSSYVVNTLPVELILLHMGIA